MYSNAKYLETLTIKLEDFIIKYYEKVSVDNAQQIINDFKKSWKKLFLTKSDYTSNWLTKKDRDFPRGLSKYSLALIILSDAYCNLPKVNKEDLKYICNQINELEDGISYNLGIFQNLFYNLGLCWTKLGEEYNYKAIEAFKKYSYYIYMAYDRRKKFNKTAYAFKKCDKYLYQSLIKEELNLSSPTTFNDPFDCPIMELLNCDDKTSSLVRQAYKDCLKIACFIKTPYYIEQKCPSEKSKDNKKIKKIHRLPTHRLMWAHYADSHKGICIKYNFDALVKATVNKTEDYVSFYNDVTYSNSISNCSGKDYIKLKDAFFLKGKEWEYENELRFLYYNLKDSSEHSTISIPNCIEAIYFGLKCSEEDKKTIATIMLDKGNIHNKKIKLFEMVIDKDNFGQIKAKEYNPTKNSKLTKSSINSPNS